MHVSLIAVNQVVIAAVMNHTSTDCESGHSSQSGRQTAQGLDEQQQPILPPADCGKDAILFVIGAFCVEGLIWGFPYSFGVFQEYYRSHEPFSEEPSGIAPIGTCAMVSSQWMYNG